MFNILKHKYIKYRRIAIVLLAPLYLIACGGGVTGDADNFISVDDQALIELDQVNIANASTKTDVWIVIYKQDALLNRKGDTILGKLALTAGDYNNISLKLDSDVMHGETLYAELRKDDGEVGVYEPSVDNVISQAAITAVSFVVNYSSTPYISAEDQQISSVSGNTIQVKKVISENAAWLVAYRYDESAENNIGAEVGYQQIRQAEASAAAIHQSKVNIGLEVVLAANDQLIIVLYDDKLVDDGDFSMTEDTLVLHDDGTVVSARITILDSAD